MQQQNKEEKLNLRDNYLDKEQFKDQSVYTKEHYERAKQFFNSLNLTEINLEFKKIKCPKCGHSHKMYCLECGELLWESPNVIPKMQLPVNVRIIHHEKEKFQKSSALPIQFLSDQVKTFNFPSEVIYEFGENDYILYPHQDARSLTEFPIEELVSINSITAVDCTWRQTNQILKHLEEKIPGERKYIKLGDYETYFWRYQHHSLKCLATVEAIYYFFREYQKIIMDDLNYDELLYFYRINFLQIQDYQGNNDGSVYDKVQEKKDRRLQQKIQMKQQQKGQKRVLKQPS